MSRYIMDVELNQPIDVVSMVMEDFIYHNRFIRADWNGEMVFFLKDNHGRERYMKWYYADGVFHVEAWLKGPFGNETDLDGAGGGASKREFRDALDNLAKRLKSQAADSVSGGHVGSDPLHHDSDFGTNHDTWKADTQWQDGGESRTVPRSNATNVQTDSSPVRGQSFSGSGSALICAVAAIMFGGWFPIFGIIFAVVALRKSDGGRQSQIVRALAIVAIVVSVMGFLFTLLTSLTRLAFLF